MDTDSGYRNYGVFYPVAVCGGLLSRTEKFPFSRCTPSCTEPKREQNVAEICPVRNRQNRPFFLTTNF